MPDRLNPNIMTALAAKLGKTPEQIGPRLSELRRKHSGLTMNAAAQMYALSHGTSIMGKLGSEDRRSLASVQAITQVSVSTVSKVDRRTLNVNNSSILNLSFGDRNSITQNALKLDKALSEIVEKIEQSDALTTEEKSDYKSDIQTIASQVGKTKPNHKIIKAAWASVKNLATLEGFTQLVARVAPLIASFLS